MGCSIVLGHKKGLGIDGRPSVCAVVPLVGGVQWCCVGDVGMLLYGRGGNSEAACEV